MVALSVPVSNLHGSGAALFDDVLSARASVRLVGAAIHDAAPNGRDYYPIGASALRDAVADHAACLSVIEAIQQELLCIADPDWQPVHDLEDLISRLPTRPARAPVVHSNGTAAQDLVNAAVAVFRAVLAANEALRKCIPNGRDYADSSAFQLARRQHGIRASALEKVGSFFLTYAQEVKAAQRGCVPSS